MVFKIFLSFPLKKKKQSETRLISSADSVLAGLPNQKSKFKTIKLKQQHSLRTCTDRGTHYHNLIQTHTGKSYCGWKPMKLQFNSTFTKEGCSLYVTSEFACGVANKAGALSVSSVSLETECCLLIATTLQLLSPQEASKRKFSQLNHLPEDDGSASPRPLRG